MKENAMRSRFLSGWCVVLLALLVDGSALGQELTYLPLHRPGQANVAVDRERHIAFLFDLGSDQDGKDIQLEGKPLLDRHCGGSVDAPGRRRTWQGP
jgi:hypothetical protein